MARGSLGIKLINGVVRAIDKANKEEQRNRVRAAKEAEALARRLRQKREREEKEIERLKKQKLLQEIKNIKPEKEGDKTRVFYSFKSLNPKEFQEINTEIKNNPQYKNDTIICTFNDLENGSSLGTIAVSANIPIDGNDLIKQFGGKGGGRPDFVTYRINTDDVQNVIRIIKKL